MTNAELAILFHQLADLLERQGENPYRIRAYRRAANTLRRYENDVSLMVKNNNDLTQIPHIGKNLAIRLQEIVNTGKLPELKSRTVSYVKTEQRKVMKSLKIYYAMAVIDIILDAIRHFPGVEKVECGGSYRRRKEVVDDDLEVIVTTQDSKQFFKYFFELPTLRTILKKQKTSVLVELKLGMWMSVRLVKPTFFGGYLLQATGSHQHYAELKNRAAQQGLLLKKSGLYRNNELVAFSEEEIYATLNMSYIPPELRENRGEIDAATNQTLPNLVELKDIKGDLHCHTYETDGNFSLEEMVRAAREHGYEYVAITDHSKHLKITHGLDEKRLLKQIKLIDQLNETLPDITILKSIEVDILEDGSLDLSNDVLKELDLRVCSIHYKFGLSLEKQTERIIRAMDNPYFNILGHATGRLIQHRPPYAVDIDRILKAAKERNCFIEVNAQPARLDIHDLYCKKAKEYGVKVAISSDAHTLNGFNFMILGINQARRGWLEAKDVINTYRLAKLKKMISRK